MSGGAYPTRSNLDAVLATRYGRVSGALTMPIPGKLDLTLKIQVLPVDVTTNANGWKTIAIDCDGVQVTTTMRPKMWAKLEEAAAKWPAWSGAIAGKMGPIADGVVTLLDPAVQVFERKPKEPAPPSPA